MKMLERGFFMCKTKTEIELEVENNLMTKNPLFSELFEQQEGAVLK